MSMQLASLNNHLDKLFQHGLKVIKEQESDILNEWSQMKDYFKTMDKRSAQSVASGIELFSTVIFEYPIDKFEFLNQLKKNWNKYINYQPIDQFVLTIIESSIHHAIKAISNNQYKDYQAIQYVFNQISEHILSKKAESHFQYEAFLQHLVHSQQMPVEWIAVVEKNENIFRVDKWFNKDRCLLTSQVNLEGETMYEVTEHLLHFVSKSSNNNILTIPYKDKQLLLSTEINGTVQITAFVNHALQLLQSGKSTLITSQREQKWKDAVIMFNESILPVRTFDDALDTITEGFVNYLPFERCAIFSYSKTEEVGFGLAGHQLDNKAIQSITEDIHKLPLINKGLKLLRLFDSALKYLQPLYIGDVEGEVPKQYIKTFDLKSIVVVPIYTSTSNELLGAAIIDQGPNQEFSISQDIYTALIKFGHTAGEVLERFNSSMTELNKTIHFSPREIEVLKLMAEGESTTGAAEILHLSEYTVRDYITSVMQKMKARNRTEAVARAIRKGVI